MKSELIRHTSFEREEAFDNGKRFAEEVGCYVKEDIWDGESIRTCLGGKSARDIFEAQVRGECFDTSR